MHTWVQVWVRCMPPATGVPACTKCGLLSLPTSVLVTVKAALERVWLSAESLHVGVVCAIGWDQGLC